MYDYVIRILALVGALPDHVIRDVNQLPVLNKRGQRKQKVGPMLTETRKLLEDFYRPFKQALAQLLNDEHYLWRDETLTQT